MDSLCHTTTRTVAPGVPLIYHLLVAESYRADGYSDSRALIGTVSPLPSVVAKKWTLTGMDAEKNEGCADSSKDNLPS